MYLRHATTGTVNIGPFIDITDGITAISGVVITDNQVQLLKGDNGPVQKNSEIDLVYTSGGWYQCVLDTIDTNTIGRLIVQVQDPSIHLPVWHEFYILPTGVFDTYYGANAQNSELPKVDVRKWVNTTLSAIPDTYPQVDVQQIGGLSSSASNLASSAVNNPINVNVAEWLDVAVSLSGNLPNVNIEAIKANDNATKSLRDNIGNLDAAVSTRSSHSAADVWAVGTRELTAFSFVVGANLVQISGDNNSVSNLMDDYDGTGYNKDNSSIGAVGVASGLSTDAIGSGDFSVAAMQYFSDIILARSVKEVEATADKYSLTRVILASTNWETVEGTGLLIKRTDDSEFDTVPILSDESADLIVTLG